MSCHPCALLLGENSAGHGALGLSACRCRSSRRRASRPASAPAASAWRSDPWTADSACLSCRSDWWSGSRVFPCGGCADYAHGNHCINRAMCGSHRNQWLAIMPHAANDADCESIVRPVHRWAALRCACIQVLACDVVLPTRVDPAVKPCRDLRRSYRLKRQRGARGRDATRDGALPLLVGATQIATTRSERRRHCDASSSWQHQRMKHRDG